MSWPLNVIALSISGTSVSLRFVEDDRSTARGASVSKIQKSCMQNWQNVISSPCSTGTNQNGCAMVL